MGRHSASDDAAAGPALEPADPVEEPRRGPVGWQGPEPDPTSLLGWPGDLARPA